MTQLVVSICMPCFNVSGYVETAINSILGGVFDDFEIVCVDDGSTDSTLEVLKHCADKDSRVKVFHQPNGGVSRARNACIEHAQGKYLMWVDPDDTVEPGFLSLPISLMESEQADYAVLEYRQKDLTSADPVWHDISFAQNAGYDYCGTETILKEYLPRVIGVSTRNVLGYYEGGSFYAGHEGGMMWRHVYRTDIVKQHGIRCDENIMLNEDGIFNCEYMQYATRMVSVDKPLYNYAIRSTGGLVSNMNGTKMLRNKISLLQARNRLEESIRHRLEWSILPMYAGSLVLSLLQMLADSAKTGDKDKFAMTEAYFNDSMVKKAISAVPVPPLGRRLKFAVPLSFLKLDMLFPLWLLMRLAGKLGVAFHE